MRLALLILSLMITVSVHAEGALTATDVPRLELDERTRPPKVVQRARSLAKLVACPSCGGDGQKSTLRRCSGPG